VCSAAAAASEIRIDSAPQLLHHLIGAAPTAAELDEIAYRAVALQHLFARCERRDREAPRLPVDLWGEVRLTAAQWEQLDLDEFGRRLDAERSASGWDPTSLENRQNWRRIGIDDLWPSERA
jgi:hypothetical protein